MYSYTRHVGLAAGMDCFGPRHMSYSFGCNAYLMATYTALPAAATSAPPARPEPYAKLPT